MLSLISYPFLLAFESDEPAGSPRVVQSAKHYADLSLGEPALIGEDTFAAIATSPKIIKRSLKLQSQLPRHHELCQMGN